MLTAAEWAIVALSLKVAFAAIALTLPVAFALAWVLARKAFYGRMMLDTLVHLPLVLPPVVTGWLLLLFFGAQGTGGRMLQALFGTTLMFRWTGAALAAGIMALPLMVRAIRLSLEAVDRRLESAARTLGASRLRAYASVTLPLALPGIGAAVVLGFARSLGEFGATITFVSNVPGETRTLPLAIYTALQVPGAEDSVTRMAIASVVLSLAALAVSEWLVRRGGGRAHVL
ncbi:molybdate ABC transporter permease subunit [Croceicoccus sp. BE223]|uniref:molybdate ABC transporter permease subunit n=1 Tax=Croceicoccus sp. BE223 TaxID=2817716 RepID=UPI00286121CC|nr:molybdate ABC transporter permease subunit [Croceicoccus sp. BE223]MDR7102732.1 molybdate transport system permease protein [Croceicoccus sp. BE223]